VREVWICKHQCLKKLGEGSTPIFYLWLKNPRFENFNDAQGFHQVFGVKDLGNRGQVYQKRRR
jgi:hypothetical protein